MSESKQKEPTILQSELSPNKSIKTRKAIKFDFNLKEREQNKAYIADLERSITINKEIIVELIKNNVSNGQSKKIIEMLNTENTNLHNQVKRLIDERNGIQGKLLISEQIIQNFEKHEEDLRKELTGVQRELVDQLNRKEFALQKIENRYDKALNILNNVAHKDQDVREILKKLKADRRSEFKLTNVVEENERLQAELDKERELVKELTVKLNEIKSGNIERNTIEYTQGNSYKKIRSKSPMDYRTHNKSLMGITNENTETLKKEIAELSKKIIELYKVNVSLSDALDKANKQMIINRGKYSPKRSRNLSRADYRTNEKPKGNLIKLEEQEVNITKLSVKKK